jgi:hypothetical protein
MFPSPLLTRNQVELMQIDTVSSPEMPGFVELEISPHSVEATAIEGMGETGAAPAMRKSLTTLPSWREPVFRGGHGLHFGAYDSHLPAQTGALARGHYPQGEL